MRKLLAVLCLPFVISGCATAVVSALGHTGITVAEDRSIGTKVDDHVIIAAINDQFLKSGHEGLVVSATVNVREGRVLLTGNVPSAEMAQEAVAAARRTKGVREVYDELIINPDATYGAAANDILIKKNMVARILLTKDIYNINYSSDVVAGNAYIIGRTKNQAELDKVLQVIRTTKGVKKVVSYLVVGNATNPQAAPVQPVTQSPVSQPSSTSAPTDGTITTESVDSNELDAPATSPIAAPSGASKSAAPTWR